MTNLQIQKMKDTECLLLTKWQLFCHYIMVYTLIIASTIITITTIQVPHYSDVNRYYNTKPTATFELFLYRYIWLIFAMALYIIQTRRLKFKVINISIDEDKFIEAAQKTAKELDWELKKTTGDIIIAKTGFSWRSRGELITIIRDNDRILINSIPDPDEWPSVTSFGRNKENRDTYEQFVRDRS